MTSRMRNTQANARKARLVQAAIALNGSTTKGTYIYHSVWTSPDGVYEVSMGKFGKEYYETTLKRTDGTIGNNPNDMKPTLFKNGVEITAFASFDEIFRFFEDVYRISVEAIQLIGCLMYRNAFLIDFVPDTEFSFKYAPPQDVVDKIKSIVPEWEGIDIEAFIHYLDAIAWNEDIKYYSLGYHVEKPRVGRTNNMLTYVHIISLLLGHQSLSKFCGAFSRGYGVAPLTKAEIIQKTLPQLWDSEEETSLF